MSALFNERVDVAAVERIQRQPNTRLEVDAEPAQLKRLLECYQELLGDGLSGRAGRQVSQQDGELVAAEARDGVAGSEHVAQPRGQFLEEKVAAVVSECVVDFLEMVQIDDQNPHLTTRGFGCGNRRPHPPVKECSVRQPRQVIVQRPVFRSLAFFDRNPQQLGLDMSTECHHRGQYQEGAEVRAVPAHQQRCRAGHECAADDDGCQSGLQQGRGEDHWHHVEHPEMRLNPACEEHSDRDHEQAAEGKRQHEHEGSPPLR